MKRTLLSFFFACVATLAFSQLNMTLLDQVDYGVNANDIWAWVDPDDGTEYAVVGLVNGVSIVDLSDPENVVEILNIPGPSSTWRDIKTWGEHVYVTNETSNGVLVIDMTDAPNDITWFDWTPDIPGLGTINACHNLYIDEFGYCYLSGCNVNSGGILVVDVFSDPGNPQFESALPAVYSHDVYARDNKVYDSQIFAGQLAIYDVEDKQNMQLLATQTTPFEFTHNAWLNDAGDVVFTTDETGNAPIGVYDISDLDNIVELDQFVPIATMGQNVIPHNVHVWQDWLIISYYTDGGIIADASKPDNVIEVGNWDTFLGGNGGFSGVWGAYPFLPSGLVLLTDIGTGLYVCGADYVRACWLEGQVTDAVTGDPIFGAEVDIASPQANFATTDLGGEYKTGQAIPGMFDVTFSANGYQSKTVQASLENGVLTILNVELEPLASFPIGGQVVRASDGTPIEGAQVLFQSDDNEYTAISDASGNFSFASVLGGEYNVYAGTWGYFTEEVSNVNVNISTAPLLIELDRGYQDDFILDFGWETTGNASTGQWERGEPVGTDFNGTESNPEFDIDNDLGDQCFVTGNGGGGAGNDDIDNGIVVLTSPPMDLSNYNEPTLSYNAWFFNDGGNGTPDDAFEIRVTDGTNEVVLETIENSTNGWLPASEFVLTDFISASSEVRVIFEASDLGSGHLAEAAVDAFRVDDVLFGTPSETEGCEGLVVDFESFADGAVEWLWTFEGGTPATSTEANPSVEYNTAGVFNVSLTATTSSGAVLETVRPNFVTVNGAPVAGFSTNTNGATVVFTNTSTGGGTVEWDFGDMNTSDVPNPIYEYTETGIFTVTQTVTNECGSSSTTQTVEIIAVAPTAVFSANVTEGCAPLVVEFTDLSEGSPNEWEWSFPGGTPATSTEQNPTVTYDEAGIFSVQMTALNAAGESQVLMTQFISVNDVPSVDFTFVVNGNEVIFTNGTSNADAFEWQFGDLNSSTSIDESPTFTYGAAGEYDVTLTAQNDCGIEAYTQTVTIDVTSTVELDESDFALSATPNPFAEQLMVNYELMIGFEKAEIQVLNVLGEVMSIVPVQAPNGSISLDNEITQSGVYFIQVLVDGRAGEALRVVKI